MQVGFWQIILIVLLFVLLFGSKRIPELMKDFVKGLKAVREEIDSPNANNANDKKKDSKSNGRKSKPSVKRATPKAKKKVSKK